MKIVANGNYRNTDSLDYNFKKNLSIFLHTFSIKPYSKSALSFKIMFVYNSTS